MVIEFMTGATVFALIRLTVFFVSLYFIVTGFKKMYAQWKETQSFKDVKIPSSFFYIMLACTALVLIGSATQPKLSIDTPQNRELLEYQENNEEVTIETPPPRTETLQGFESLK